MWSVDPSSSAPAVLSFQLRGQDFALPIAAVKETIHTRPLTRLPLCPPCIAGLVNVRGEVIAVLDIAQLLRLPQTQCAVGVDERRIVLLRSVRGAQGHGALCGLLVDRLTAARRLPPGVLYPPPVTLSEPATTYLTAVARIGPEEGEGAGPLLLLLDPERLLACEELRPFRQPPGNLGEETQRGAS